MLHPTLWANCPYGIHNILSVEYVFKFLNEAKVMTMLVVSQLEFCIQLIKLENKTQSFNSCVLFINV